MWPGADNNVVLLSLQCVRHGCTLQGFVSMTPAFTTVGDFQRGSVDAAEAPEDGGVDHQHALAHEGQDLDDECVHIELLAE